MNPFRYDAEEERARLAAEGRPVGPPARPALVGPSEPIDRPFAGWLFAGLGACSLFVALGIASAILAYSATFGLRGVNLNDPTQTQIVAAAGFVSLLPLVAGPILATVGGFWAGTRARDGGEAALGAGLGSLVGLIILDLLTALGYAIGANSAGITLANVVWPNALYWRPGWANTLGLFGTSTGLVFIVACILAAVIAAVISHALAAPGGPLAASGRRHATRRAYERMPRV